MKNLIYILLAMFLFSCSGKKQDDAEKPEKAKLVSKRILTGKALRLDNCSKSVEAAEEATKSMHRAQHAKNTEDMRDNAEEAMEDFHKAAKFSKKCGCEDAMLLADEGYSLARKASLSVSLDAAREYAEIAKNSAEDLATQAYNCSKN